MSYIGNPPRYSDNPIYTGTGDGSTVAYTLTWTPPTQNGIEVFLGSVIQRPGTDYTVSGTTLTFTSAPPNGVAILVYALTKTGMASTPAAGSVQDSSFASSVTGTGNIVRATSPTITTPNIVVGGSNVQYVAQVVQATTTAFASGTTTIPLDDTIPQSTEGDQYLSVSITPKTATSTLIIDIVVNVAISINGVAILAMFQDSTANASAVTWATGTINNPIGPMVIKYKMTSGTTSSTTFKVRGGCSSAGVFQVNGASGARYMGGAMVSSITVTEIV